MTTRTRTTARLLTATALLALCACASGGGGAPDVTEPVLADDGAIGPERNFLMSDLSFGSPGNRNRTGRTNAIDEVFDAGVTTLTVETDPEGGGRTRVDAARLPFGSEQTVTYDAAANSFTFDVETTGGTFDAVLTEIMLADPTDFSTLEHDDLVFMYASNPSWFTNSFASFGISPPDPSSGLRELDRFFAQLFEQDRPDGALAPQEVLGARAAELRSYGEFVYGLEDGLYRQNKLRGANGVTEHVAIGSWRTVDAEGNEFDGHLVFGTRTPLSEVPVAGTLEYNGAVVGTVLTNNALQSLTGTAELVADFRTGVIDMSLATIVRVGGGQNNETIFDPYRDMTGRATISGTTFSGSLIEANEGDATGTFDGAFFGPRANEVGGNFEFGDGGAYAHGAFTGRDNTSN